MQEGRLKKNSLKGKTAVITGASGGIGRVIVEHFLREGANVAAADIKRPGARDQKLLCVKADITKPGSVNSLMRRTAARFGRIDVLVNAAGVQKPIGDLTRVKTSDWIRCVMTNIAGTMLCCKAVIPLMKKRGGSIINFSGGGATFPRANFSAYGTSKAAIVRFTETIAEEFRKHGIRVNAVSPGSVYTGMMQEIIDAGKDSGESDYRGALKVRAGGGNSPEAAARLCAFLASDAARKVSGKLLSAVWDDPATIIKSSGSSLFTMRRIDNRTYFEK